MKKTCDSCESEDTRPFYVHRYRSHILPEFDVIYLCDKCRIYNYYIQIEDIEEKEIESYFLLTQ
jgi:hypothetical protein